MKTSCNKTKTTVTIAVILLMTSVMLFVVPAQPVEAQLAAEQPVAGPIPTGVTPDSEMETIAHLSFRPDPVGLGQPFIVNTWIQTEQLHMQQKFIQAHRVTITKPDGTQEVKTMNSYPADATTWFEYFADQVGIWTIKFDFLGMYFPAGQYYNGYIVTNTSGQYVAESHYCTPSSDGPYELVVQEELTLSWPPSPLPTDYWTRPVSVANREWWPILGNFPATGVVGGGPDWPTDTNPYAQDSYRFVPYVQGPNSAHVLWKRQFSINGLIGGSMGYKSVWTGPSLSGGQPSIIYAGRAYQTLTKVVDGQPQKVWQCYDLRTGEVYWEQYPAPAEIPTFITYNPGAIEVVGAQPFQANAYLGYVGNGKMIRYDPYTGAVTRTFSIAPLTTGTLYADPYYLSVQDLGADAGDERYRLINWTIATLLGGSGGQAIEEFTILNNVTWPWNGLSASPWQPPTIDFDAGIAVMANATHIMTASLTTGKPLHTIETGVVFGTCGTPPIADQGKFAQRYNDGHWHCWDLYTGNKLWVSELSSWPWATFGAYSSASYGGIILSNQYDAVAAISWTDGKVVWKYVYDAPYPYESPYTGPDGETVYPFFGSVMIADGKLYTCNAEHSPDQPIKRGWKLHCINATTGEGIWNITATQGGLGAGSRAFQGAIADGYLAMSNAYDGYMYVYGKGKSATTVTAPQTAVPNGNSVVITGTVLDQSPGQPGTPCVSKESMTTYMEYLHMQGPIGGIWGNETILGVPVSLDTVDPNGNYVHIGDVVTDGYSGTFGFTWTPEIEGQYAVTATFNGDESYGSSFAQTYVSVGEATEPYPTPIEPEQPADNTSLLYGILAAVIVAIVLGIVAVLFTLKK